MRAETPQRTLTIALQVDGALKADWTLAFLLVRAMKVRGHEPILVVRAPEGSVAAQLLRAAVAAFFETDKPVATWGGPVPAWSPRVIYASVAAPRTAVAQAGIRPDVWIDDEPYWPSAPDSSADLSTAVTDAPSPTTDPESQP